MPTRVYDGPDCVLSHAAELSALGNRALLVTGRHSAKACGALDDVTGALEKNGKTWCVFSGIEENPSVETVTRAAVFGKTEKADFVVGIGGGSAMDAAKAAAFLMKREEFSSADLYDKTLPPDALPVAAVPTTCGTGSEVTGVSVLTMHEKKTKGSIPHKIFPRLALVDGKYLQAASRSLIVNTSLDALAHMAESFESRSADDYSKSAVLHGLSLWKESREVIAGKREAEEEDFARLMRASTFAGIAIAQTGTSIPHALSYILTYDAKIPHGLACGYFLPGFLAEAPEESRNTILHAAGFADTVDFDSFMAPLLADVSAPEETLRRAYDVVLGNTQRLSGCAFFVDADVLGRIAGIRATADGD